MGLAIVGSEFICALRYWLSIPFLTILIFVYVAQPWIYIGITYWAVVTLFVFADMELCPAVVTDIDVLSHADDNESTVDALEPT